MQNAAARTVMKCKSSTSLPFLASFIGFPSRNWSATKFSLTRTGQFTIIPPSTSLIFSINTPLPRLSSRSLLHVPRPRDFNTKRYGHQAFRYVAPSVWNGPEGRPWMFDVTLLSGISRLSFESPFLSPLFSLSLCLSLSVSSSVSVCLSVCLSLSLASFFLSSFSA